jgi:hypothetical protein
MGISSEQSDRQRLQGLVPASDISTCRIGDLASSTGCRTPGQNGDCQTLSGSAERHVGRARGRQACSALGDFAAAANRQGHPWFVLRRLISSEAPSALSPNSASGRRWRLDISLPDSN